MITSLSKEEQQELLLNTFNADQFKNIWDSQGMEKANEYAKQCEEWRKSYVEKKTVVGETYIEINTGDTAIQEGNTVVDEPVDMDDKESLVRILKDNGMKLASTKWSLETLQSKVASLTQ